MPITLYLFSTHSCPAWLVLISGLSGRLSTLTSFTAPLLVVSFLNGLVLLAQISSKVSLNLLLPQISYFHFQNFHSQQNLLHWTLWQVTRWALGMVDIKLWNEFKPWDAPFLKLEALYLQQLLSRMIFTYGNSTTGYLFTFPKGFFLWVLLCAVSLCLCSPWKLWSKIFAYGT